MSRSERIKEILKASPDFGKRVGFKMCVVDELHDIQELEKEAEEQLKRRSKNDRKRIKRKNAKRFR